MRDQCETGCGREAEVTYSGARCCLECARDHGYRGDAETPAEQGERAARADVARSRFAGTRWIRDETGEEVVRGYVNADDGTVSLLFGMSYSLSHLPIADAIKLRDYLTALISMDEGGRELEGTS